jgi:hypothetical protein
MSHRPTSAALALLGVLIVTLSLPSMAADPHVNPDQSTIDSINDRKSLIDAQDALIKSQTSLIKDQSPAFDDNFGKKGALTVDTADRDKFHVTARSAEAFSRMADKLAAITKEAAGVRPILILVDADRSAVQALWAESTALSSIETKIATALKEPPKVKAQAAPGVGLFEVGTVLSQIAQFTQLFRTDKNVSFTDSLLTDDVLLDLVAIGLQGSSRYPQGETDRFLSKSWNSNSDFGVRLSAALSKRDALVAIGDPGKDALKDISALSDRLATPDATTKLPELFTVLRGELVQTYLSEKDVLTLSVRVVSKGGASLKTSSIWRSDRLYASGGVITSYRISDPKNPALLKAGVLTMESEFEEVPLISKR